MRVRLTDEAKARLHSIHDYIATDSPQNALRVVERILSRVESLNTFASRGRGVPEYEHENIREIPESPYRIIYRVTSREIQVLSIMHQRQLLPGDLSDLR